MARPMLQTFLGPLPLDRFRRKATCGLCAPVAGVLTVPRREKEPPGKTQEESSPAEIGTIGERPAPTLAERAAPYVGSPRVRDRVRAGGWLFAVFRGASGVYRVTASESGRAGTCTCPAERRPCKHIVALAETARRQPHTFSGERALVEMALEAGPQRLGEIIFLLAVRCPREVIEALAEASSRPSAVEGRQLLFSMIDGGRAAARR